jgi:hypothetical protein
MPSDYLCNLVVPGAAKSGTSALHDLLAMHPEVAMSRNKEPHHFCRADKYPGGARTHNALFESKDSARVFGESSTGYLPSPVAAERIANDLSDPRAILLLRHPVDRSFSHYRWRFRLGLEKRSFLDAMREDGYGYNPDKPSEFGYLAYLEFSQYSEQVPRWEAALGVERCLAICSADLRADLDATLARCHDFLGLDHVPCSPDTEGKNETDALGRRPPRRLKRLLRHLPSPLRNSALYKRATKAALKATAPEPPREMTERERAYAEEALAPAISWFEARFPRGGSR